MLFVILSLPTCLHSPLTKTNQIQCTVLKFRSIYFIFTYSSSKKRSLKFTSNFFLKSLSFFNLITHNTSVIIAQKLKFQPLSWVGPGPWRHGKVKQTNKVN